MRFLVLTALIGCVLLTSCKPGLAYRMPTEGMLPTIDSDDLCVANPFGYSFGEVQRFDLVVFKPNAENRRFHDKDLLYVMRAVGLPGEMIEIRENAIYVNGKLTEEPFAKITDETDRKRNFGPALIPADEYFFLGDNRPNSEDSRYWAKTTIHKDQIVSKIVDIKKDFYKAD